MSTCLWGNLINNLFSLAILSRLCLQIPVKRVISFSCFVFFEFVSNLLRNCVNYKWWVTRYRHSLEWILVGCKSQLSNLKSLSGSATLSVFNQLTSSKVHSLEIYICNWTFLTTRWHSEVEWNCLHLHFPSSSNLSELIKFCGFEWNFIEGKKYDTHSYGESRADTASLTTSTKEQTHDWWLINEISAIVWHETRCNLGSLSNSLISSKAFLVPVARKPSQRGIVNHKKQEYGMFYI